MRKSSFAGDLKGPPAVRPWATMDHTKDGSPCVIKRRFGYWQTNLNRLSRAEKKLSDYRAQPKSKQHDVDITALQARIDNRLAWVEFSAATLQNSIRFARARITPDGEDYKLLMKLCPQCGTDTETLDAEKPFVTGKLESGKRRVCCLACCDSGEYVSVKKEIDRRPIGRMNKKFHDDLRYFDRVLEQFFLAKKSVAGNSLSADAFSELRDLTGKTVGHFKNQSAREADDAEQAAVLGLMEAARKFDPDPKVSKRAKFTTYASLWIRRRAQARKTSHCKPGVAIIKGKHVSTARIDMTDNDEGHADRFHPGTSKPNLALKIDVAEALADLDEQTRDLITDHLIHRVTLVTLEERTGLSISKIRGIINSGKAKLATALAAHAN